MSASLFPDHLRAEYDKRVLDAKARSAKAAQLQSALIAVGLWQPPRWILDVGCGSALILAGLDTPNAKRIGCDMRREPFLKAGVDRASVAFAQCDARYLPFRGDRFDLVLCLAVIAEFQDWRATVERMAECVAPGGVLYVTVTNGKLLVPLYNLFEKLGVRVEEGWWHYAQSSLRFASLSASDGFRLMALHGWRHVAVTPYLARAQCALLRFVPIFALSWLLQYAAPSFGYAWQRPNSSGS